MSNGSSPEDSFFSPPGILHNAPNYGSVQTFENFMNARDPTTLSTNASSHDSEYDHRLIKCVRLHEDRLVGTLHPDVQGELKKIHRREVSVTDLFFDLIFASAVGAMNDNLKQGAISYENYFLYFLTIFIFWNQYTVYESLFGVDDFYHKPFAAFYGFGVIFLSIHTDHGILDGFNFSMLMFSGSYLCALQMFSLWRARVHCEERIDNEDKISYREEATRGYLLSKIYIDVVLFLIYFVCAFVPFRRAALWFTVLFRVGADIYLGFAFPRKNQHHVVIGHFSERFEAFTLIVLGETIGAITKVEDPHTGKFEFYAVAFLAFMCVFCIKLLHFDVDEVEHNNHAFKETFLKKFFWLYSSAFEGAGIALMGASIGNFLQGDCSKSSVFMFGLSMGLIFFCNGAKGVMHEVQYGLFAGAQMLWVAQRIATFCVALLALQICFFYHNSQPWRPLLHAFVLLFSLDVLMLFDEVFEYYHVCRELKITKGIEDRGIIPVEDELWMKGIDC